MLFNKCKDLARHLGNTYVEEKIASAIDFSCWRNVICKVIPILDEPIDGQCLPGHPGWIQPRVNNLSYFIKILIEVYAGSIIGGAIGGWATLYGG
jgi:hypothetical protein